MTDKVSNHPLLRLAAIPAVSRPLPDRKLRTPTILCSRAEDSSWTGPKAQLTRKTIVASTCLETLPDRYCNTDS